MKWLSETVAYKACLGMLNKNDQLYKIKIVAKVGSKMQDAGCERKNILGGRLYVKVNQRL